MNISPEMSPELLSHEGKPVFADSPETGDNRLKIEFAGFDHEKAPINESEIKDKVAWLKDGLDKEDLQPGLVETLISKIEYNPVQVEIDEKYGLEGNGAPHKAAAYCYFMEGKIVFYDAVASCKSFNYILAHEFGHLVATQTMTEPARATYLAKRADLLAQGKIQDTRYVAGMNEDLKDGERLAEDFALLMTDQKMNRELSQALKEAIRSNSAEQTKINLQASIERAKNIPDQDKRFEDSSLMGSLEYPRKKKPGEI
ncbi:MAG TPA: hypothetical protein VJJ80_02030 [Patescibacteria group bacterium]|nr:hypothetical protein [Patescibacteria group bacterium]